MPIDPAETDIETNDAPPSLRDTLTSAFDTQAEEPRGDVAERELAAAEPREGETQEQADQRARDAEGRFAKQPKKPAVTVKPVVKPAAVVKPGVKPVAPLVKPGTVPTSAPAPAGIEMKAPQSFRGPAKEAWAQTPEAVRVEVLRREKEIATQLQGIGEERKYASTMKQAFAPFEAQIRAEGSTPEAAIGKLLNTGMLLRTGPPHLKAAAIADMITTFGVPLEGLVAALQGKQPAQGQQQQHQPQQFDPATIAQQVEKQLMERLGTQRDTALVAKAEAEVSTFLDTQPMHGLDGQDYSEEIRQEMADLIEAKAKRGSTISLERAYTLVAREHPEVSKVLERQEQAAKATKANASTSRARAASSSVRHSPTTSPVSTGKGASLRDQLDAAFDQAAER